MMKGLVNEQGLVVAGMRGIGEDGGMVFGQIGIGPGDGKFGGKSIKKSQGGGKTRIVGRKSVDDFPGGAKGIVIIDGDGASEMRDQAKKTIRGIGKGLSNGERVDGRVGPVLGVLRGVKVEADGHATELELGGA